MKKEPRYFYREIKHYRQFVENNPDVIVVSDSQSYAQHPDTMHIAACAYVSGQRQTVGHWGKRVFPNYNQDQVTAWYERNERTPPRICSRCERRGDLV
jgi:hypothetical protein